jgi:hypothetical protein
MNGATETRINGRALLQRPEFASFLPPLVEPADLAALRDSLDDEQAPDTRAGALLFREAKRKSRERAEDEGPAPSLRGGRTVSPPWRSAT